MFFFFNDTATTEIYTLSLHDALPIWELCRLPGHAARHHASKALASLEGNALSLPRVRGSDRSIDRKSTRLNSSHANISYAVFCLKKKKKQCNIGTRSVPPIIEESRLV